MTSALFKVAEMRNCDEPNHRSGPVLSPRARADHGRVSPAVWQRDACSASFSEQVVNAESNLASETRNRR